MGTAIMKYDNDREEEGTKRRVNVKNSTVCTEKKVPTAKPKLGPTVSPE